MGTPIINVDYAEKHKKGVWGPEANQKPLTFNSARLPHRPRYIAVVQCIGLYQNWITQTLMFRPTPKWNVTCFLRFWTKRSLTKGFPMGVILRKYLEVGGGPELNFIKRPETAAMANLGIRNSCFKLIIAYLPIYFYFLGSISFDDF